MMLAMSVRCSTCGNYMYKGTKFTMRMEVSAFSTNPVFGYLGLLLVSEPRVQSSSQCCTLFPAHHVCTAPRRLHPPALAVSPCVSAGQEDYSRSGGG